MAVGQGRRNFDRFGIVGYKDETGIGRQCRNMRIVLNIGFHLVAPSTRLPGHKLVGSRELRLSPQSAVSELRNLLDGLRGIIVIERNKWHSHLFEVAHEMRKTIIVVPNWEWFDCNDTAYDLVDLFVTHSDHTSCFLTSEGYRNVIKLPPPIDLSQMPIRRISGQPSIFIHNAGIIDRSDRKGTIATLNAWRAKTPTSSRLIVRYQRTEVSLPSIRGLANVEFYEGTFDSPRHLYVDGDCAIQPSRLEGLGYMMLEPIVCGIPTVTTDAPPMNEWRLGTRLVGSNISPDISIPHQRGIGNAKLFDADISALTRLLEELENKDLKPLANEAREFRRTLSPANVGRAWTSVFDYI